MLSNPIILKELIQASHRKRLFLIRMALPLGALIVLGPRVLVIAAQYGGDWRMMKQIADPLFTTCAWMMFVAFVILAASEAQTNLHREWSRNTMEVLCATPIGFTRIVYGKLAGILLKVFSAGLALLPILGVWLSVGRMPPAKVGGALGIIVTSSVLAASLSLMNGATTRPGRKRFLNGPVFVLLYAGLVGALAALLRRPHPLLVGAIPPWSFYCVMNDVQLGGLSPARFALLVALEPLVIALAPILLSPWVLARTYRKVYGAKAVKRPKHWYVPGPLRRFLYRRPVMRPAGDPFFWQEKGTATVGLRAIAWGVPAVIFIPMLGVWALLPQAAWRAMEAERADLLKAFFEPDFYLVVAYIMAGVMSLATLFYAANVFAREKGRKTLDAFMMLVGDARKLYRAKLKAVFWALRWCYPTIGVLLLLTVMLESEDFPLTTWSVAPVLAVATLGPLGAATLGLVFSASAKSSGGAVAGIILSPFAFMAMWMVASIPLFFTALIGGMLGGSIMVFLFWGVLAAVGVFVAYHMRWRWKVWKLTFLLALVMQLMTMLFMLVTLAVSEVPLTGAPLEFTANCAVWGMFGLYWYRFGARTFEGCMLGERVRQYSD